VAPPHLSVVSVPPSERLRALAELDTAGVDLPLGFLPDAWAAEISLPGPLLLAKRNHEDDQSVLGALALSQQRALKFGREYFVAATSAPSLPDWLPTLLRRAQDTVTRDFRALRINCEVLAYDQGIRACWTSALLAAGFRRRDAIHYSYTLVLELTKSPEQLLAGIHRSARRNIRQIDRLPVQLRCVEDPALAPRVQQLLRSALERTGGHATPIDWVARIRLAEAHPARARLVGVFRTDRDGANALIAFGWGERYGERAVYADAGVERQDDIRVPMSYAILWDLVTWARAHGARWFDLGGITGVSPTASPDPLSGISAFKRFFSDQVLEVQSWSWTPRTAFARAATFFRYQ
jgi:hypothetical protein